MRKPYTLVEILVAVSIIGILTATGLGITSYVRNKVAETQTKTTIKLIEMALQKYNSHKQGEWDQDSTLFFAFPAVDDITSSNKNDPPLKWKCFNDVTIEENGKSRIRGIRMLYEDNKYYLLDGWGRKMFYLKPGVFNADNEDSSNTLYDLISFGADGFAGDGSGYKSKFSEKDDSKKWTKDDFKDSSKYPDEIGDDVTNFTRN